MRRGVGDVLMWAGAAVGVVGAVLLAMGAWMNLPPALVIAIAKALPFVVAAALLTLGAIMRRHARRATELRALAARSQALLASVDADVAPRVAAAERLPFHHRDRS